MVGERRCGGGVGEVSAVCGGWCAAAALTVDLRRVASSLHPDPDVHQGEALHAQHQHGLQQLQAQQLWLEVLDGLSIDLHQPSAPLAVRNGHAGLLTTKHLHTVHHPKLGEGGRTEGERWTPGRRGGSQRQLSADASASYSNGREQRTQRSDGVRGTECRV